MTEVIHKIAPKVGLPISDVKDLNDLKKVITTNPTSTKKEDKPLGSNLIPINTTTAQVLAARAAAIAAAQKFSAQLLQQKITPLPPTTANTANFKKESAQYSQQHQHQQQQPQQVVKTEAQLQAEKEAEQKRLEEEMRKRRERIEKWRNEKKLKDKSSNDTATELPQTEAIAAPVIAPEAQKETQNNKVCTFKSYFRFSDFRYK